MNITFSPSTATASSSAALLSRVNNVFAPGSVVLGLAVTVASATVNNAASLNISSTATAACTAVVTNSLSVGNLLDGTGVASASLDSGIIQSFAPKTITATATGVISQAAEPVRPIRSVSSTFSQVMIEGDHVIRLI